MAFISPINKKNFDVNPLLRSNLELRRAGYENPCLPDVAPRFRSEVWKFPDRHRGWLWTDCL